MDKIYNFIYRLAANNVPQHKTMTNVDLAKLLNPLFGKTYSLDPSKAIGLFHVISLAAGARHEVKDSGGAFMIERFYTTVKGRHPHEKK